MNEPRLNLIELTVSELSASLKRTIEDAFDRVRVRGELGNVKYHSSGHVYLDLKDDKACLAGIIWRTTASRIKLKLEAGLEVVVTGRITTYPGQSKYQIVIDSLEPAGLGALMALVEERKRKLAAEGLFDASRKQLLPFLPSVIGVITSPTGAVIRDILHRLRDRFPRRVLVWPVKVQGEGSAEQVAAAIHGFNALAPNGRIPRPDLLIVARGGGSLEDLWAFNEEVLARVIAACQVPIISGVGHETDFTICDFVADLRAPTPSAAAELVVRRKDEFFGHIDRICERLDAAIHHRLRRMETKLHVLEARPGFAGYRGRIAVRGRHVAELAATLRHCMSQSLSRRSRRHDVLRRSLDQFDPRHRLGAVRTRLVSRDGQLQAAVRRRLATAQNRVGSLAARIEGLSPLAVLGRGYSVTWDASRTRIIRDAATLAPGDDVSVTLERGSFEGRVTKVDP
jgi:exodeoxyribonuclease VII large subunit